MIASEIMLPPHAPEIYLDRATLWNAVESCEKHPKAQLAYSFDIAMQNELTLEENMELARKFVQEQFVAKGMIADLAFHSPEKEDGGIPNPHFHVMTTMRPLNPDGTWGQKQRREYLLDEDGNRIRDKNGDYMFNAVHATDWHEPETLEHWREQWAAAVNTKFEEKGLDVRIDHRSYVRQGLDLIPTVHEGANVRQMEAKGIRTEKGELNRWIKATNRLMQDVRKKIKALFVWMAEVKEELSKPQTPSLADLLIAYYNQRNAGAWSNKARTGNLKQFVETVNYLTENKLLTLEDLQERLSSVSEEFEALSGSMKKKSARIKELQELIREGENYQRLKPVHTELNNIKFKKQREKFETSHDAELRLFYAARRILKEKLDGKPIALKAWKQEYAQLKTEYAELSPQHKPLREEVIRLRQVQNAVDTALRRREHLNVFEAVKQSVTTRQAASFYGIRVGRNGMVCCPFHNDRTPSMKVDSRFYCFGCGASGDVIDFAALLHGLGKREAAVRLAKDFGVSYEKPSNAPPDRKRHNRSQPRQKSAEQRFQETERYCFRVLCDYLRLLEHWKTAYAPQPQDAIWHPLFVEALQRISYTEYLLDILLYGEIEEKAALIAAQGKEVLRLEQRISELAAGNAGSGQKDDGHNGTGANTGRNPGNIRGDAERRREEQHPKLPDGVPA